MCGSFRNDGSLASTHPGGYFENGEPKITGYNTRFG